MSKMVLSKSVSYHVIKPVAFNITAIIPTRLIFSTVRESIRDCVFTTPIKRRAYLDVSRRNRAGTTKKNCDTQLDSTKRRNAEQENGNKTENWQRIY